MKPIEKQTTEEQPKTRVTLQIWEPMAVRLEEKLQKLFIKRDSYLNELFKREIERLDEEFQMKSKEYNEPLKNTEAGFLVLKRTGALLTRTKMNIFLNKDVALRMDEILGKYNIPRDSFCNRIIAHLCHPQLSLFLLRDYMKKDESNKSFDYLQELKNELKDLAISNIFDSAYERLLNPFSYIRESNNNEFYTINNIPRVGKSGLTLYSLNTWIPDQTEDDEKLWEDLV